MSDNILGEHGPETATALAKSHTLEVVSLEANILGDTYRATATALANSRSLIHIKGNDYPDGFESLSFKEITYRNLASLARFADRLIEIKDQSWFNKTNIKHLGHLGPYTKAELGRIIIEKGGTIPDDKYFADHFFQILGVCKVVSYHDNAGLPKTKTSISDLPPDLLELIGSFLSFEDWY